MFEWTEDDPVSKDWPLLLDTFLEKAEIVYL